MILVDTSILIDFLRGSQNAKIDIFDEVVALDIPFGISAHTYQEILQGARNERDYKQLREYLGSQAIYHLPEDLETYDKAARLFYTLRRRGVTVRGSIDVLIALTAMENGLMLLHNDRDFDAIASKTPALKILTALP